MLIIFEVSAPTTGEEGLGIINHPLTNFKETVSPKIFRMLHWKMLRLIPQIFHLLNKNIFMASDVIGEVTLHNRCE